MSPNLYARFALQRAKLTADAKKWERFRPIVATAFLQEAAFHHVGLYMRVDLGETVRVLAKKHHVRVREMAIPGAGDALAALKSMPLETVNTCVEASLATVERDLPRLAYRAQAWAVGDIEHLESSPEPAEVNACRVAVDGSAGAADLIARMRRTWLETMVNDSQSGQVTLALVDMDLLLGKRGLLEELQTRGYSVDPP